MKFQETPLKDACVIDIEPVSDERGFFARNWCRSECVSRGLHVDFVQSSISFNYLRGTLRGMHFQVAPHQEAKLVRCTRGALYDVIIDLRPASSTFEQWTHVELSAANRRTLFIPVGFAHGFQTLQDDTEVFYEMSLPYSAQHAGGVRWDDPTFRIDWPLPVSCMSARDLELPLWQPRERGSDGRRTDMVSAPADPAMHGG
ncbi:MAG: dTDP-4-dehydrorhamnose 3,5-epimerase [Dehalococcoidia bacterium]